MAELEATMDVEEEAGWLEFYRLQAEEHEAEMKRIRQESKARSRGR